MLSLISSGTPIAVPCPDGKRVRILSVLCQLSAPNEGDQIELTISQSTTLLTQVATNEVSGATLFANFFLGASATSARLAAINPVSGAATFSQTFLDAVAALPNVWWNFEVIVATTLTGTTTLIYEEEPNT